ncbi:ABC transporter ATP-binding protein [Streptomyces sp. NPDC048385]|uniref:ABC transporter ATP-binding protein n=1 Tax=unclassified Streptomyces TaxID=2593676 RepID=UPI00343A329E
MTAAAPKPAPSGPLLAVRALRLETASVPPRPLVHGLDLDVQPGESVGIVGESGSGKSLTARAVAALLPGTVRAFGSVVADGREIIDSRSGRPGGLYGRAPEGHRGRTVSLLMQDPFTMLHPLRTCGRQIADGIRAGAPGTSRRGAALAVTERLAEVGLAPGTADRYPHELSGGMRQRAALAAALAPGPRLLIADEPTTAVDAHHQGEVLALIRRLQQARGMGLLLITHDLRVAFSACDRLYVMYAGTMLESGPARDIETRPAHPYTAALLAAEPSVRERYETLPATRPAAGPAAPATGCPFAARCAWAEADCRTAEPVPHPVGDSTGPGGRLTACRRMPAVAADVAAATRRTVAVTVSERTARPLLQVRGARKSYGGHEVLHGVDLEVPEGGAVGLVGESGSGKSTLARLVTGLEQLDGGRIVIAPDAAREDTGGRDTEPLLLAPGRPARGSRLALASAVQIVFQDPYSSLNPVHTVGSALREAAASPAARRRGDSTTTPVPTAEELLESVGLPAAYAARRPAALSGGERQRVAIARALAVRPRLLVCDESVSALDVSVQAQILTLLARLRQELGLSLLLVTHDLAVARQATDQLYVMHRGRIVERGRTDRVLDHPEAPYTRQLLAALPGSPALPGDSGTSRRTEG